MENRRDSNFRHNLILVIVGVTLLVALLNFKTVMNAAGWVIGLFMPLITGGVIAFILNVPMSFFERQADRLNSRRPSKLLTKAKTAVSLILTLIAFVAAVYFIGKVIFPNLAESAKSIALIVRDSYPVWMDTLEKYGMDTSAIKGFIAELDFAAIAENLKDNLGKIIFTTGRAVNSVVGVVTNFAFGLVFAIYILLTKKKLGQQARKIAFAYLKKEWADEVCRIAALTHRTFSKFISGQCLEAVILGTMFVVVLSVGGFPSAATIGVIIGAMALIPFVGAFIGMVFGILLVSVEGIKTVIIFVIVFFIVQQIEGQIIYPRVVGSSVGLPAMWTLLAVVVGGSVSGIFGIIVFIPLFAVLYVLLRENVYMRLSRKKNAAAAATEELQQV